MLEPGSVYRLALRSDRLSAPVSLQGPVRIGTSSTPTDERIFAVPRLVEVAAARDELVLDLTMRGEIGTVFAPVIDVTDLATTSIDEHVDPEGSIVRRVSTIVSGSLYLSSLDDRERPLRTGEVLVLGGVYGEIASLALTGTGVKMHFRGRVREMAVGWGEHPRSLMPTWLEWLQARHGLSLLWGGALYFFGLAVGVMRWWGLKV
jgi:hypothetical protein